MPCTDNCPPRIRIVSARISSDLAVEASVFGGGKRHAAEASQRRPHCRSGRGIGVQSCPAPGQRGRYCPSSPRAAPRRGRRSRTHPCCRHRRRAWRGRGPAHSGVRRASVIRCGCHGRPRLRSMQASSRRASQASVGRWSLPQVRLPCTFERPRIGQGPAPSRPMFPAQQQHVNNLPNGVHAVFLLAVDKLPVDGIWIRSRGFQQMLCDSSHECHIAGDSGLDVYKLACRSSWIEKSPCGGSVRNDLDGLGEDGLPHPYSR